MLNTELLNVPQGNNSRCMYGAVHALWQRELCANCGNAEREEVTGSKQLSVASSV